jgi:hypothetical protein
MLGPGIQRRSRAIGKACDACSARRLDLLLLEWSWTRDEGVGDLQEDLETIAAEGGHRQRLFRDERVKRPALGAGVFVRKPISWRDRLAVRRNWTGAKMMMYLGDVEGSAACPSLRDLPGVRSKGGQIERCIVNDPACAVSLRAVSLVGRATSDTFRCPNVASSRRMTNSRRSRSVRRPTSVSEIRDERACLRYYDVVEIDEWTYDLGPSHSYITSHSITGFSCASKAAATGSSLRRHPQSVILSTFYSFRIAISATL